MAVLLAGFPLSVPASTINRLCGSSMDAIHQAARAIWYGEYEIVIAGGVENMTRAPYAIAKNVSGQTLYGNLTAYETDLGWRFPNPRMQEIIPLESMGETAENVASMYNIPPGRTGSFRPAQPSARRPSAKPVALEGRDRPCSSRAEV